MKSIHNILGMSERRKELRRNSTPEEDILWQRLRNNQLGFKFRRQHSIGGYVADFYCAQARLVIEIDGDSHSSIDQKEYDVFRSEYLGELNHEVLRFKNIEISNELEKVVYRIKVFLELRGVHPSPDLGEGQG
jgi:very-short-patch-repair endonuclease